MSDVPLSRRSFLQAGAAAGALAAGALTAGAAAPAHAAQPRKVLRYAFRVAETGFDPAQVNDLYSSTIIANLFEAPLTYDYLARPAKIVPNTAESMPEISADYRTFTFRIRPGIRFLEHPAFKGKPRELVAADYVYSLKRFYDPRLKSPRLYLFETAGVLGMGAIRGAALMGAPLDYDREVEGLRVLDRYTFRIALAEPSPRFFQYFADNSFTGAVAREVLRGLRRPADDGQPGRHRAVPARRVAPFLEDRARAQSRLPRVALPERAAVERPRCGRGGQAAARPAVADDRPRRGVDRRGEPATLARLPQPRARPRRRTALRLRRPRHPQRQARAQPRAPRHPDGSRAARHGRRHDVQHGPPGGRRLRADKVALRRAIALAYSVQDEIRLVRNGQSIPSQSPVSPLVTGYDPAFAAR